MSPSHRYQTWYSDDADSEADENDMSSVSSFPPFSPGPSGASSQTSDYSMRSVSPVRSVWSMTSSLRAQAFKQEYGRGINNYSEVYRLPADEEELERLGIWQDLTHRASSNARYRSTAWDVQGDHGQISSAFWRNHGRRCSGRDQMLLGFGLRQRQLVGMQYVKKASVNVLPGSQR
jgi:hypothetical protein